jgi:Tektin family
MRCKFDVAQHEVIVTKMAKTKWKFSIFFRVESDSKNTIATTYATTDKVQKDTTKNLQHRAHLVDTWKATLERAIQAMVDEMTTMEDQKRRLRHALFILQMPESIGNVLHKLLFRFNTCDNF